MDGSVDIDRVDQQTLMHRAREYFESLQRSICASLETIDRRGKFTQDPWVREGGGGGLTRVMESEEVFEKAAVNTSSVHGMLPERMALKMSVPQSQFRASGISLVIHPRNPFVPIVHANLRYFDLGSGDAWFGGGVDLTPIYLHEEDVHHFHHTLKAVCDHHNVEFYPRFKRWCDQYFTIDHRQESRGVGGIFFDYLRGDGEGLFRFVQDVGNAFVEAYLPIVRRRMNEQWGERERQWQLLRRGRYVEFNLVYDRGTAFGLETNGRAESILASLPPVAGWRYNVLPEEGSGEHRLLEVLRNPRDWT